MDQTGKNINGRNVNIRYPIASVSKLFTSLLATTTFNLKAKFSTDVYVTPVDKTSHDVHITGSADPYFNRYKMHMIISRLNEAGVKKIRHLTFDENVKYLHDTDSFRGYSVAGEKLDAQGNPTGRRFKTFIRPTILKADLNFPSAEIVRAQLQQQSLIMQHYPATYNAAQAAGINLYKNAKFVVGKTLFRHSSKFKPTAQTFKIYVLSQDVQNMVKAINWNSNNYTSNRLLTASGGLDKLNSLYFDTFKVSPSEFNFVNGSGQNHSLNGSGRIYNEASCSVVLRTIKALRTSAENQQSSLENLVAVMGTDAGSTVGGAAYKKPFSMGKVVAKTGTIGTNVTLGGMINGLNGPHYFFYNVQLAFPGKKEENRARALINRELAKLIKSIGGATAFNYKMNNPLKDNMDNYDEDSQTDEETNLEIAAEAIEELY